MIHGEQVTQCPKCKNLRKAWLAAREEKVRESYGKSDFLEFEEEFRGFLDDWRSKDVLSLEQKYSVGVDECFGFSVSIRAKCGRCGFSWCHRMVIEDVRVE